jgi:hypothetical protein
MLELATEICVGVVAGIVLAILRVPRLRLDAYRMVQTVSIIVAIMVMALSVSSTTAFAALAFVVTSAVVQSLVEAYLWRKHLGGSVSYWRLAEQSFISPASVRRQYGGDLEDKA